DGRLVGVRYAGTNGRAYRSLAQALVARGLAPAGRATLPAIRRYLAAHPAEQEALLAENERYTFFRLAGGEPVGSLGIALTPGRPRPIDEPTNDSSQAVVYFRRKRRWISSTRAGSVTATARARKV